MNQRERFLTIIVGGLLIGLVVWSGIGKYQTAVKQRRNQLSSLENEKITLTEQMTQGFIAERQMFEYQLRSLPSDVDEAKSDYQQWLLDLGLDNNVDELIVDPTTTLPVGDLYQKLSFRLSGKGNMPDLMRLLYQFYAKDYLHRIRELNIRKLKTDDQLTLEMSIDAIALTAASDVAAAPTGLSWRVDGDVASYIDPIMNRNFFEPPNQAPMYSGNDQIEAIKGRDSPTQLAFRDEEGDRIELALIGEVPDSVRLDSASGTLRVNSDVTGEFELIVRATDNGYPSRSIDKTLNVRIVEPPEPTVEEPKLAFDDATQTVLTGLVQGRDDWTAWMHVRTRDQMLYLQVGDKFEIGSLKGTVVEMNDKFVVLEIDGRKFTLKPNGNLKEAASQTDVD